MKKANVLDLDCLMESNAISAIPTPTKGRSRVPTPHKAVSCISDIEYESSNRFGATRSPLIEPVQFKIIQQDKIKSKLKSTHFD